jgi:hypothetical protein|tara:strand:- start:32518 stop:33723 length:1206 start_codon:yes stop_codon:yes gene_type:complete
MTNKKLKILFIPADNIKANISRSYYFAKGLAKYSDLYFLTWNDYRSIEWLGGKKSKLNTIKCFLSSFFVSYKLYKNNNEDFQRVKSSVFIDAIIGRLIGKVNAKKIMRKHNSKSLKKIINRINPDVVFYSDACYFFPAFDNANFTQVIDIQDDIDWSKLPVNLQEYEKNYRLNQYKKVDIHYIVSKNALENVTKNIGSFPFKVIYNGSDFKEIQKDFSKEINDVKNKLNLHDKYIITHIGSATWVDPVFTEKLFSAIWEKDKSIVLILVGSMKKINLPNVINVGMVSANNSYIYYRLTDLGLLLKDSKNSNFLYNSVPLKNIQYATAEKPVISFPIQWLENEKFNNTRIIKNTDPEKWLIEIQDIRSNFKWSEKDTIQWKKYDWEIICNDMFKEIEKNLKS